MKSFGGVFILVAFLVAAVSVAQEPRECPCSARMKVCSSMSVVDGQCVREPPKDCLSYACDLSGDSCCVMVDIDDACGTRTKVVAGECHGSGVLGSVSEATPSPTEAPVDVPTPTAAPSREMMSSCPMGADAADFNVVVLADMVFKSSVDGSTLVCGDLSTTGGTGFGQLLTTNCDAGITALAVHGNVQYSNGQVNNRVLYNMAADVTGFTSNTLCGKHTIAGQYDCGPVAKTAYYYNDLYCGSQDTGNATLQWGTVSIDGSNVPAGGDVFVSLSASDVSGGTGYKGVSVDGKNVIINVRSESASFQNHQMQSSLSTSKTIWNFCGTQEIKQSGFSLRGLVLAPRSVFIGQNSHVEGQLIAEYVEGSAAVKLGRSAVCEDPTMIETGYVEAATDAPAATPAPTPATAAPIPTPPLVSATAAPSPTPPPAATATPSLTAQPLATVPECPLGEEGAGFNVIVLRDMIFQSDTEGTALVCGNLLATGGIGFGTRISTSCDPGFAALAVHGDISFSNGQAFNQIMYNPAADTSGLAATALCGKVPIGSHYNCGTIGETATSYNDKYCSSPDTGSSEFKWGSVHIDGSSVPDGETVIVSLDASDVAGQTGYRGTSVDGKTVVINVRADSATFKYHEMDRSLSTARTVWNFCGTKKIEQEGFSIRGMVLAPEAVFNGKNSHVEGQLLALDVTGNAELHIHPFLACASSDEH